MTHTKQQAIEKATLVLKDLDIDYYFEDSFKVISSEENENIKGKYNLTNAWWVYVEVPNEQFDNITGTLVILINDENMEPAIFLDGSGGRIPPIKITKKNNKYQLGE